MGCFGEISLIYNFKIGQIRFSGFGKTLRPKIAPKYEENYLNRFVDIVYASSGDRTGEIHRRENMPSIFLLTEILGGLSQRKLG